MSTQPIDIANTKRAAGCSLSASACSRCAALEAEIARLREALDWQNMPNRREPVRGGYEFYINEEWTGIRDAALGENAGFQATLMKTRFDPDDERVRVRRVIDDDALLADARKSSANADLSGCEAVRSKSLLADRESLLDWAETLLCNAVPMSHCTQADWDARVTKWRDEKHGVPSTANSPICGKGQNGGGE